MLASISGQRARVTAIHIAVGLDELIIEQAHMALSLHTFLHLEGRPRQSSEVPIEGPLYIEGLLHRDTTLAQVRSERVHQMQRSTKQSNVGQPSSTMFWSLLEAGCLHKQIVCHENISRFSNWSIGATWNRSSTGLTSSSPMGGRRCPCSPAAPPATLDERLAADCGDIGGEGGSEMPVSGMSLPRSACSDIARATRSCPCDAPSNNRVETFLTVKRAAQCKRSAKGESRPFNRKMGGTFVGSQQQENQCLSIVKRAVLV